MLALVNILVSFCFVDIDIDSPPFEGFIGEMFGADEELIEEIVVTEKAGKINAGGECNDDANGDSDEETEYSDGESKALDVSSVLFIVALPLCFSNIKTNFDVPVDRCY